MKNYVLLMVYLALFSGCVSIKEYRHEKNSPHIRLYVFNCGEAVVNDLSVFTPEENKNVQKKLIDSCFLIKHPKGVLLWDTGYSDEIAKEVKGKSLKNGLFHVVVKKPFLAQLAELRITPQDINMIAFSHFHADHVGNANAFVGAKLLIQQEEYDAAFNKQADQFGFSYPLYEKLSHTPKVLLHGDYDVFGDNSVVIKRAIGHTPGHQALFVNLAKMGPILISGDLYHFTDNRIHRRVPSFNWNKEETKKSMNQIEDFVKKTHATMWIQHDYDQISALNFAPSYYE